MSMQRFAKGLPALVAGILIAGGSAQASPVVINMGTDYWANPAVPTEGGPWMRATFSDAGADTVTLKLERLLTDTATSINRWAFNLDPSMNLNALQINQSQGPQAHVLKNANGVHMAGGSMFDIRLMWPANQKFDGNHETATFTLSMPGLTPQSFLAGSVGGHPTATNFLSAALLGDVNGGPGVTWVTHDQNAPSVVPLPPAVWAGAAGLAFVGAYVRRRRNK